METRNRTGHARGARLALTLIVPLALGLAPLLAANGQRRAALAAEANRQVAFTFTPEVTPIPPTGTPMATALATLGPQPSPVPLAPTAGPPAGTPEPPLAISGGDEEVGYDFLEGSDPPLWRIWYQGREIIVNPDDPATPALLDEFRSAALRRAAAEDDEADARQAISSAKAGTGWGAVAFIGGGITALVSCAGVPFTFWAAGGTGWTCAGGVAAAVGGGGGVIVSAGEWFRAGREMREAREELDTASLLAEQAFETLETHLAP
ncbi:MAG: hypothetical protein AB1449_13670 [Chloroflexota bacterium]